MTLRHTDPVDLSEEYQALLRRDWAVRVLDAWADSQPGEHLGCDVYVTPGGKFSVTPRDYSEYYGEYMGKSPFGDGEHETRDEARLAAAKSVYLTLSRDEQARLGVCP